MIYMEAFCLGGGGGVMRGYEEDGEEVRGFFFSVFSEYLEQQRSLLFSFFFPFSQHLLCITNKIQAALNLLL